MNKVLEHFFGYHKICNHAVFHGADSGDVARCTAEHALGFSADSGNHFLRVVGANGHYRGLVQHDSALTHVDQGVGGAQVDGQIAGEDASESFYQHSCSFNLRVAVAKKRCGNFSSEHPCRQGANGPQALRFTHLPYGLGPPAIVRICYHTRFGFLALVKGHSGNPFQNTLRAHPCGLVSGHPWPSTVLKRIPRTAPKLRFGPRFQKIYYRHFIYLGGNA